MNFRFGIAVALASFLISSQFSAQASDAPIRLAQAMSKSEAFAASKELNTVEGWQAYLNQYPGGFRADLARAYVKKLRNDSDVGTKTADTRTARTRYVRTRNAAIQGHNTKQLFDVSVEQCLKACTNETEFLCKSIDYYKGRDICDLSDKNATEVGGLSRNYPNDPYDHYAREFDGAPPARQVTTTTDYDLICVNGSVGDGECRCPSGFKRVRNAPRDYTCKRVNTIASIVCKYGYVSGGKCRCKKGRTRVKKGNRRYTCVRKKVVSKKKKKPTWERKDCSSLIPKCLRKCKKSSDQYCEINCQQMCALH